MKALIPIVLGILAITAFGVAAEETQWMEYKHEIPQAVENFAGTDSEVTAALEASCYGVNTTYPYVGDVYFRTSDYTARNCIEKERVQKVINGRGIVYYRCIEYEVVDMTWARCFFKETNSPAFKTWWEVMYNKDAGVVLGKYSGVKFFGYAKFPAI